MKFKLLLFCVLYCISPLIVTAQHSHKAELDSIYALQAVHYKAKDYQKIIDLSHYAKKFELQNAQDSITMARITAYIGYANNRFNNFYGSIAGFEAALTYIPKEKDKAIVNTNYGILYDLMTRYYSLRRYKKALAVALEAEEFINTTDFIRPGRHAWLYQRKFRIYSALGFYDKAKVEVEKIRKIAESIPNETKESQRYAWIRYYRTDLLLNYDQALYLKDENLEEYLDKKEGLKSRIDYNLSQLDSIYTTTETLQNPQNRSQISNLSLFVGALYYVSDFYKELEDYPKSLDYIEKAISLSEKSQEPQRNVTEFLRFRANVLNLLGKTNLALAQIDSILNHFEPNTYNVEETYVFKGDIYAENKALDSTLFYYTKAIRFMHNSTDSLKSDFSNYASRYQYINDAKQLEYMAYTLMDKFTDEQKAIEYSNILNNLAYNEFLEGHKNLDLSVGNKQLFYKILNNKLYLNKEKFDEKEAFVTNIENINNAFAWRKFSQSRNIAQFPLIDSLENIEYNLRKQIVAAKKKRQAKREDSLQVELSSLHKVIAENYPILANYTQNNFLISDFQDQLNSNEIVLKYLFFYDQFVIISITKTDISFHFKLWKSEEKDLVKSHLKLLEQSGNSREINPKLTELLLPESAFNFESLIVVPDTPIYNLPFETLSYNSDYLIKEKAIHYSSHLRFVRITDSVKKQSEPKSTIFAPEYASESTQLVTRSEPVFLEGAQKEAKWLESLFPSESFIGEKATKTNFIENKTKGNILHLAMHASVDDEDPSFSHFNFANDEKLYLEELYALKIPADLAVLSACNTGIGKEDGTSSMASLQRAFNYAGTTATIASLWEVPDETTSQIMISFYDYLKDGETKSTALQKAKIDYLTNAKVEKLKHPYYWAGFVLYGDDAAVVESSDDWLRFVLGISTLLIIFIIFRKRKKT